MIKDTSIAVATAATLSTRDKSQPAAMSFSATLSILFSTATCSTGVPSWGSEGRVRGEGHCNNKL